MAVTQETVELSYQDIVDGVPIAVDIEVLSTSVVYVYHNLGRTLAVQGVDYTIALDNENDDPREWPTTFTITPLAALLTKINDAISGDPGEENIIYVRRQLDYLSDFTATDAFLRAKIAAEFDKTVMRMQQLAHDFGLITDLATAVTDAENAAATAQAAATAAAASLATMEAQIEAATTTAISEATATATAAASAAEDAASNAEGFKTAAETAAAAAAAAVGGVRVSDTDTTPAPLDDKIAVDGLITKAVSGSGDETFTLTVPVASEAEAEAGTADDKAMTPERVKQAIDALAQGGMTFISRQTVTSSATVNIPVGATRAFIRMVGAGQGASSSASASGGQSGGYLEKWLTGLTPGNTLTATIGAGGSGNGGTTTLASGTETISTLTANGGGTSGGTATGGDLNVTGALGGGHFGVNTTDGNSGFAAGGSNPLGTGGRAGTTNNATATSSGAGYGGGAASVSNGASGANANSGVIIIDWYT